MLLGRRYADTEIRGNRVEQLDCLVDVCGSPLTGLWVATKQPCRTRRFVHRHGSRARCRVCRHAPVQQGEEMGPLHHELSKFRRSRGNRLRQPPHQQNQPPGQLRSSMRLTAFPPAARCFCRECLCCFYEPESVPEFSFVIGSK